VSHQDADEPFFDNVRFQPVGEPIGRVDDDPADGVVPTGPRRPTRRTRFKTWRRSRPFWGGLLCILGGVEIALIPLTAYRIILVSHSVAIAALVGAVVAILGLMLWMTPSHNKLYGLVALVLALVSFVTSNVGGFVLGGLVSIIGGALGFAWDVLPERSPSPEAPQP
jgi:drug/metabolite transporter (DMT)-like permease